MQSNYYYFFVKHKWVKCGSKWRSFPKGYVTYYPKFYNMFTKKKNNMSNIGSDPRLLTRLLLWIIRRVHGYRFRIEVTVSLLKFWVSSPLPRSNFPSSFLISPTHLCHMELESKLSYVLLSSLIFNFSSSWLNSKHQAMYWKLHSYSIYSISY